MKATPLIPDTPAARLAFVLDLYAPPQYDEDGEFIGRDPAFGVITRDQALELLDAPGPTSAKK